MQLKLDDDGNVVTKKVDGKLLPVYERNGKEETHDASSAIETIKSQANEIEDLQKSSGKQVKGLEKELGSWKRLGEIADVRKAVKTAENLSKSDIDIDSAAQELATLRAEKETLEEQLNEASDRIKSKDVEVRKLAIGNEIKRSKFIREELIDAFSQNPDLVERLYGENFRVEDGAVRAYGNDGKPILHVDPETNKARPATVDEAFNVLIGPEFRKPSGVKGSDAPSDGTSPVNGSSTVRHKGELRTAEQKAKFIADNGVESFNSLPPAPRKDSDVASI